MEAKLSKLAAALKSEGLDEEADEVEEMTEAYFRTGDSDWRGSLPSLSGELYGTYMSVAEFIVSDRYSMFEWAGSGAFRYTLAPKGDSSYVVKIARSDRGSMMNKSEFDKQLLFEGMFPRVWDHGSSDVDPDRKYKGSEFDWVIIDRVTPIGASGNLVPFFPELSNELKAQNVSESLLSPLLGKLLHWKSSKVSSGEGMDFLFINSITEHIHTGDKGAYKLLEMAERDPMFRRLANLSARLGIDAKDLGTGNLGINAKGDLMILDASLEKDFSESTAII